MLQPLITSSSGTAHQKHRSTLVPPGSPSLLRDVAPASLREAADSDILDANTEVSICFRSHYIPLELISDGRLNSWEGPALRGLLGKPLRDSMCILRPLEQRVANRKLQSSGDARARLELYCKGCTKQQECVYGQVFEPDLLQLHGRIRKGVQDGMRLVTVAMPFPGPEEAEAGMTLFARVMTIGDTAESVVPLILEKLAEFGTSRGLGPDHVCFEVDPTEIVREDRTLRSDDLPRDVDRGKVPLIHLRLGSPLSLKGFDRVGSKPPGFADLVKDSIRTVLRVVRECGQMEALQDVNVSGLVRAAEQVECEQSQFEWFEQSRSSRRQQLHGGLSSQWEFTGWTGSATYRDVPISLLPWLTWAGHIGLGDSRTCGAGLWCLDVRA